MISPYRRISPLGPDRWLLLWLAKHDATVTRHVEIPDG
jgi:hypothetical protein